MIYLQCFRRVVLRRTLPIGFPIVSSRCYASQPKQSSVQDLDSLLSKPTWSVQSLLPDTAAQPEDSSITVETLRHLLRLSALPQPSSKEEEDAMLQTLQSQIHFVKEIQAVNTTNVAPLRSIRDESEEAVKESTIGLDRLRDVLEKERVVGRSKRIQRMPSDDHGRPDDGEWDGNALGSASKTKGKYFVVEIKSGNESA